MILGSPKVENDANVKVETNNSNEDDCDHNFKSRRGKPKTSKNDEPEVAERLCEFGEQDHYLDESRETFRCKRCGLHICQRCFCKNYKYWHNKYKIEIIEID